MTKLTELIPYFERLTGRKTSCIENRDFEIVVFEDNKELGYSQFNEIMLLLGFDRVDETFFKFIANGPGRLNDPASFTSLDHLNEGIARFVTLALEFYGNIKFAFNLLATDSNELIEKIIVSLPHDPNLFKNRHGPLIDIHRIEPHETYYLGYIIQSEIKEVLKKDPDNRDFIASEERMNTAIKIGQKNQIAYLSSDHLDVYVATSMRKAHEYISVSNVINKIFNSSELTELKLRWFDPTQAYCNDRIDKGLSEALMLKRATCTLYLAQESETLGKDSELASTLAQGKPVITYVPIGDKEFVDSMIKDIQMYDDKGLSLNELLIEQIRIYDHDLAWHSKEIRDWLDDINNVPVENLMKKLYFLAEKYYNSRAKNLKENHPLGIQVNLRTGVANGVLVARTIEECVQLIKKIILNDLEFDIIEEESDDVNSKVYLREKISESIFRIKTNNILLTNAFWNFYR